MNKLSETDWTRVDADVLDWFKAQGEDYEQRINVALRIYAEAHNRAA